VPFELLVLAVAAQDFLPQLAHASWAVPGRDGQEFLQDDLRGVVSQVRCDLLIFRCHHHGGRVVDVQIPHGLGDRCQLWTPEDSRGLRQRGRFPAGVPRVIRDPRRRRGVLRFLDHAPGFGLRGHRRQLCGAQGAELREIPGQIAQLLAAALM
jgi:hypothetical protein